MIRLCDNNKNNQFEIIAKEGGAAKNRIKVNNCEILEFVSVCFIADSTQYVQWHILVALFVFFQHDTTWFQHSGLCPVK